jgi:fructose-1,6-bisphosphatase I
MLGRPLVSDRPQLDDVLSASTGELAAQVAQTVGQIARVAIRVAQMIADGPLAGSLGAVLDDATHGDPQTELDVLANRLFLAALKDAPVAAFGSEETADVLVLNQGAPLAVAIDPLDGSSNIDTNVSIGTIFSIRAMSGAANGSPAAALLQRGSSQLAAGFVIYGPQTALVLTLGQGTQIFTLDRRTSRFVLTEANVRIPSGRREYAINASNYRHWDEAIQTYVDDCIAGVDGPRGQDFNMRWIASLVAEAFRILGRGGIFLYPADRRPGYDRGRLRLVYEAHPLALVIEQAGGAAIDGFTRILDLVPHELHQRTPLIFGSADKVARVARYHAGPPSTSERSPLFARRGLFYHP